MGLEHGEGIARLRKGIKKPEGAAELSKRRARNGRRTLWGRPWSELAGRIRIGLSGWISKGSAREQGVGRGRSWARVGTIRA